MAEYQIPERCVSEVTAGIGLGLTGMQVIQLLPQQLQREPPFTTVGQRALSLPRPNGLPLTLITATLSALADAT